MHYVLLNRTPRYSYEVSAAGLSWLEHFRMYITQHNPLCSPNNSGKRCIHTVHGNMEKESMPEYSLVTRPSARPPGRREEGLVSIVQHFWAPRNFGGNNLIGSLANYLGFLTTSTHHTFIDLPIQKFLITIYWSNFKGLALVKSDINACLCRLCIMVTRFSSLACVCHTKGLETRVA